MRAELDALDAAVVAAQVDGRERVLASDMARMRRGLSYLLEERQTTAAYTLALAVRRTALFIGADEAVGRLLAAAEEAGVPAERALGSALLGALRATVPRL